MFEVGFWELALCLAIALVVLGPEKLPGVIRTVGRWTGRARAYVRNLSSELEREAGSSDLKRDLGDAVRSLRESTQGMKDDLRKIGQDREPRP
ncbi:MAG TPA: Sec-independent protein translocase protein TatB [Verrucomicrobiae bacterium]|nr:Sec-independent protein translocase protein TatB [Verrucomicrobiae bacterium]